MLNETIVVKLVLVKLVSVTVTTQSSVGDVSEELEEDEVLLLTAGGSDVPLEDTVGGVDEVVGSVITDDVGVEVTGAADVVACVATGAVEVAGATDVAACVVTGSVEVAGAADVRRVGIDGILFVRDSRRCLAGLSAARLARPAADLSRLLRIARDHGGEAVVGRRVRIHGVSASAYLPIRAFNFASSSGSNTMPS